eukprot:TRINITY_DN9568_c0_g2_i1.p1 TRINITY_DN9568_c0_g2~~TRINITY_DN9568_c0_g2_i1.p1  ORF type:complete len:305 (-),score=91.36 TRINITY_DN9568_c0_g2_i1:18-932(-)
MADAAEKTVAELEAADDGQPPPEASHHGETLESDPSIKDALPKPLEEYSDEEQAKFHVMKEKLKDDINDSNREWVTDLAILRYLRARKFDVDKAYAMMTNTLKWREEFGVDKIDPKEMEIESTTGKLYVAEHRGHGNRPIVVMRPGKENTKIKEGKIKFFVWNMEMAAREADAAGPEKMIWVIDYANFGFSSLAPGMGKTTIGLMQDHFPERLHVALFVDPPWAFWLFFKIIRPFVDPVTRNKMVTVSGNHAAKRKMIEQHMDPQYFPKHWGGDLEEAHYDHKRHWSRYGTPTLETDQIVDQSS